MARSKVVDPSRQAPGVVRFGATVTVTGDLKHDERVKLGGIEVKVDSIEIVAEAIPETPIADDSSPDKRQDWRFLDLRVPKHQLVFRIQTTLEHAWRSYWVERDFIEIHLAQRVVQVRSTQLKLTRSEFDLLLALALAQGSVLNRRELADAVGAVELSDRALESHISRIRLKLRDAGAPDCIASVRSVGYRLQAVS